jgi:hypothetical protein
MFDQLAVLSPIMLALTAASPIFKGRLVDTDVRWKVCCRLWYRIIDLNARLVMEKRNGCDVMVTVHTVTKCGLLIFCRPSLCTSAILYMHHACNQVISDAVDDRTPAERGLGGAVPSDPDMAGGGNTRLQKSRYDSISSYIHYCKRNKEDPMHILKTYNDIPCEIDEASHKLLLENGVDPALAFHLAHLFTRDPLGRLKCNALYLRNL